MKEEILALIIASLIGLIPNLVLKIVEKLKTKEELDRVSLQSADISLDMLQDTNLALKQHIEYLNDRYDKKMNEIAMLEKQIEKYKKYIDKAGKFIHKIEKSEDVTASILNIIEEIKNLELP